VIARETASPMDNRLRLRKVMYSSSPTVGKAYQLSLGSLAPASLRMVKIIDAYPLSNASDALKRRQEKIPKLGQVDFITSEMQGGAVVQKNWVATIKFSYLGVPEDQEAAFSNWNGFTVTDYRVDQRSI